MTVLLIFLGAALGTYLIRISGIVLLSDPDKIPPRLRRALGLVGPTALGAIIVNALFLDEGAWREFGAWHIAAVIAAAAAWWTKSAGWTLIIGGGAFVALLLIGL